jgi:hypothetical protein
MPIDSKKQKLNTGQVITLWLKDNPQKYPPEVVLPAILKELSLPNAQVKQLGNTVFEVLMGEGDAAFFKAFNVDTGANFVANSKKFCVWARNTLGLHTLVTQFADQRIETVFRHIAAKPPMEGMGYQVFRTKSGDTRIALNLGE